MPGRDYPTITIGQRFQSGSTRNHLCKPTAVAVASTGEVKELKIINIAWDKLHH